MGTFSELIDNSPDALQPVYRTVHANDPVLLYEGQLKLYLKDVCGSGVGKVFVAWSPAPRVAFEMELEESLDINLLANDVQLELVDRWPNERSADASP